MRKNVWKQKALNQATKALFLAKYVLKNQDVSDFQTPNALETNSKENN
jgi:hypothetical protein